MLGHSAIADAAIADVGGAVLVGVAEMSAIGSAASVGVGTLVGVSSMSSIFTQTTEVNTKLSGNIDFSTNFIVTPENIVLVNLASASLDTNFTETVQGSKTVTTSLTQQMSFTKTTSAAILFEEINGIVSGKRPAGASAPGSGYTSISPTGVETYTEITPSGTETYTEIVR